MFDIIKTVSKRGNKFNEDYVGITSNAIFILDGSSGLANSNLMEYESEARWFSHMVGNELMNNIEDVSKSLPDIIRGIIEKTRKRYIDFSGFIGNENNGPSASISIVRIKDNFLEYFQLGDCTTLIEFNNGKAKKLQDDSVTKLDAAVIGKMTRMSHDQKISVRQAAEFIKQDLIENRLMKNMDTGYWILDLSGVGIEHAYSERFPIENVKNIALMSDGFADIVNVFSIFDDFEKLIKSMEKESLDLLVKKIWDEQEKDFDMNVYPRLKFRDDASAIWANLDINDMPRR